MAQGATGFHKVVDNDRENVARLHPDAEPGHEGWTRETQALLRMAEIARKASADARLAAQVRSQKTPAPALNSAQGGAAEPGHRDHPSLPALHDELAAAQARLKDRESVLAKAHLDAEQARESVMRETQALIQRAEQSWKAAETTHVAPPAAERREPSAQTPGGTAAKRDAAPMAAARLTTGERFDASLLWEQFRLALVASGYMAHLLVGACLAVVAIALYFAAPGLVTSAFEPSISRSNPPPKAAPAPPPKAVAYQTAIVARGVNIRAYPASNSEIIGTLPQGLRVMMIEKQGSWTLVKATGINGRTEPLVGWTSLSFLNVEKSGTSGGGPTH